MPGQVSTFDQSTLMAHRAVQAAEIGPPKPPSHVALPGAKTALEHDRLLAHQELGHGQEEIVGRVNARWESQHADRLAAHRRWAAGPYQDAIEQLARAEAEQRAAELRKRALFEALIAERDQQA